MANKVCMAGMIAIALAVTFAMAFTGCGEEETLIREELYSVQILSVTPDLIDGVEQQLAVTVEYNLQLNRIHDILLIIAFNTEELYDFKVYDYTDLEFDNNGKASGTHTFDVTLTPVDWSPQGEFQAEAYLGFLEWGAWVGSALSGTLASDSKTFPVSDDYWSITWDLNGGAKGWVYGQEVKYTGRVAKGAVLAKPSANPIKDDYIPGGWYTDSALTQKYDFAESVTADLDLYAKWEELTVEHLYGTWITEEKSVLFLNGPYTLTISANSIELVDNCVVGGDYVRYSNVVWAQQPTATINANNTTNTTYPRGYTFTGYRAVNNRGHFTTTYLGFVALSRTGQEVCLKQDAATVITDWSIAETFTKQE